jgi:hypothetical protein
MPKAYDPALWTLTFYDHTQGTFCRKTVAEACADGQRVLTHHARPEPLTLVGLSKSEVESQSLFRQLSTLRADASRSKR